MSERVDAVSAKYGEPRQLVCRLPALDFPPVSRRAHGEVCMAIMRPNGRFLLQTKASYPNSVMRLPSGGIRPGEDIEKALLREIWEETNLSVSVESFVARIRYESARESSSFETYLLFVRELSGPLRSNDPSEKITSWVEALPEELGAYADELRNITPRWSKWGMFRATALDALADHLLNREG